MLGFILSKLNLLILVTAIFAIVSFFAFGLTDIAKVKEATELASRIQEKSFALASSPSYCLSDSYFLPDELEIAGSSYYYVVKVSKRTIETDAEPINILIFSVYPREEIKRSVDDSTYIPKAIAADSFRTKAGIRLYSWNYNGTDYSNPSIEQDEIYVDPQARTSPATALELVKEVKNGKSNLYVIGCNAALCEVDKTEIGKVVHPNSSDIEGGFGC